MYELLSTRDILHSDDQTKKLNSIEISQQQSQSQSQSQSQQNQQLLQKKLIFYGLDSPFSYGNWDETPEDLALISLRISHILMKLSYENIFITTIIKISEYFTLCQRLFHVIKKFQQHSLSLLNTSSSTSTSSSFVVGVTNVTIPIIDGNEIEILQLSALDEILSNSTLSFALSIISHLKPLIQGNQTNQIRRLSRIKLSRENLISLEQYKEFIQQSLKLILFENNNITTQFTIIPLKIFQLFLHLLFIFSSFLTSKDILNEILSKVFESKEGESNSMKIFSMLYYILKCDEMNNYKQSLQLIIDWIISRLVFFFSSLYFIFVIFILILF